MNQFQKRVTALTAGLALVFGLGFATPAVFGLSENQEPASLVVVEQPQDDAKQTIKNTEDTTEVESQGADKASVAGNNESTEAVNLDDLKFGDVNITRTDKGFTEGPKAGMYGDYLSQIEVRSFKVVIPVEGATQEQLDKLIQDSKFDFDISRTKEEAKATLQDEDDGSGTWNQSHLGRDFLFTGGKMSDWMTRAAKDKRNGIDAKAKPFFKNMKLVASTVDGKTCLVYTFDNEMLFGIDGNDVRARDEVRSGAPDYIGDFHFNCELDGKKVATSTIHFRPFDEYLLQHEVNDALAQAEKTAANNGLYAKVIQYGISANGRPMKALIVAKDANDIARYKQIKEMAEENPTQTLADLKSGKLTGYKAPIFYTNIHADELAPTSGVVEFMKTLVANKPVSYKQWTGITEAGKKELEAERNSDGIATSKLMAPYFTGMGYIRGKNADGTYGRSNGKYPEGSNASSDLSQQEIDKYYTQADKTFDPSKVLDHCFFILIPSENVDARSINSRPNGNGFDLNRDNSYQTQPETQAMSKLISEYNPISLHEFHGFYKHYQLEPCSPTHDPSNEYDLFIETAAEMNEAFASVSLANCEEINSCQIPARDFLNQNGESSTGVYWDYPFDDVSTSYTPQYSMMHGVNAYTVELPWGNSDAVRAVKYGCIGNAEYVANNWQKLFERQLKRYERAVNNVDADEIRPFYVDWNDEPGAWADIYRPRDKKDVNGVSNNNFFPEYYVFPMGNLNQKDRVAASETINLLIRNDVKVDKLLEPATYGDKTYPAGTVIINMHQAKRNVAQGILYKNMYVDSPKYMFYSEPVSNFSWFRHFDMDEVRTKDVFKNVKTQRIEAADKQETFVEGKGKNVIVKNNGIEAVRLVNAMLKKGVKVGLITDGASEGSYVVSAKDYKPFMDKFVVNVIATDELPEATVIKNDINVYVPLGEAKYVTDADGKDLGLTNYENHYNTEGNWSFFSLGDQMGFNVTWNLDDANIVVGSQSPVNADEVAAKIKAGTPYVGFTGNACHFVNSMINSDVDFATNTGRSAAWTSYDALAHVSYPTNSVVTAPYANDTTDDLMYGYGGNWITKTPENAEILIKTKNEPLVEGVMSKEYLDNYINETIQGIHFDNVYLFANTLDNKGHQQHDYRYISGSIYASMLTDKKFENNSADEIDGTEPIVYELVEGNGQTVDLAKAANGATFKINADYSVFENGGKVFVDDNLVSADDYTSQAGSTVVVLKENFLKNIGVGDHTIKFDFTDGGSVQGTFVVVDNTVPTDNNKPSEKPNKQPNDKTNKIKNGNKGTAKTGDPTMIAGVIALAAAGAGAVYVGRRRK